MSDSDVLFNEVIKRIRYFGEEPINASMIYYLREGIMEDLMGERVEIYVGSDGMSVYSPTIGLITPEDIRHYEIVEEWE